MDDKFAYFASQLLPVQEASGFHRFEHKIGRSYAMISDSAPRLRGRVDPYWDIPALFEETTNVPLLTFQSLLFGSLSKFLNFDLAVLQADPGRYRLSKQWFSSTKIPQETIERFLTLVSAPADEFRSAFQKSDWGNSDFTAFRDRPFFRDGEGLVLIDFAFLAEKLEAGPFWIVHNSLPNGSTKEDFHNFWGQVFEKYCCDMLSNATAAPRNVVFEAPVFADAKKGQVCDALVICGSSAAFIELKGSTFSSRAKYGADYKDLRREIQQKLVQKPDGSPKAVYQLKRAIELTCGSGHQEAIKGVDLSRVRYVYPVVVTRDDIGSTLGVNAFLQHRFDEVIQRKLMGKIVTPLFCMNSEDLETLTGYMREVSITDLLDAHYRASRQSGPYFMNPYFATRGNSILKEKGIRRPESQAKWWHDFTETALDRLGLERPSSTQ